MPARTDDARLREEAAAILKAAAALRAEADRLQQGAAKQADIDRTILSQLQADVKEIHLALLGPFGKGGGLLARLDLASSQAATAAVDAAAANTLATDNRKRLNAISAGNALYTTVAAIIAAGIGWLGGAR